MLMQDLNNEKSARLPWAGYGRWETLCTAAVASLLIVGALSIFHQSVSQLANSLGVYIGQAGILGGLFEGKAVVCMSAYTCVLFCS